MQTICQEVTGSEFGDVISKKVPHPSPNGIGNYLVMLDEAFFWSDAGRFFKDHNDREYFLKALSTRAKVVSFGASESVKIIDFEIDRLRRKIDLGIQELKGMDTQSKPKTDVSFCPSTSSSQLLSQISDRLASLDKKKNAATQQKQPQEPTHKKALEKVLGKVKKLQIKERQKEDLESRTKSAVDRVNNDQNTTFTNHTEAARHGLKAPELTADEIIAIINKNSSWIGGAEETKDGQVDRSGMQKVQVNIPHFSMNDLCTENDFIKIHKETDADFVVFPPRLHEKKIKCPITYVTTNLEAGGDKLLVDTIYLVVEKVEDFLISSPS